MHYFIDRTTGTELTEAQFRRATLQRASLGDVVLPEVADALGYDLIEQADPPALDASRKKAVLGEAVSTGPGTFARNWRVVDLTPAELDAKAQEYADDLERVRHHKATELSQARAQADTSYFETGGKRIAVDALSSARITTISNYVALIGSLPAGWAGGWKAMDNSVHPIPDVAAWKAFVEAMTLQEVANHNKLQALKSELKLVKTRSGIDAMAW